ncbi:hypothetical protein GE09DRAFT_1061663 [Coniochaeta sp. 2T2.1]|nr:hypothetical protein GE09DRAFT_1061663 [Coniochaeta sp. 2T2.1]
MPRKKPDIMTMNYNNDFDVTKATKWDLFHVGVGIGATGLLTAGVMGVLLWWVRRQKKKLRQQLDEAQEALAAAQVLTAGASTQTRRQPRRWSPSTLSTPDKAGR